MRFLSIVLLILSANCYGQSVEDIALIYVSEFSAQNYNKAAEMVYCSNELDSNKTKEMRAGLEKELEFLTKEFGNVTDYKISYTNFYITVTLACAPNDYLKSHPPAKTVVVEVSYSDKSKGYITVGFIEEDNKIQPLYVNHGIPMAGPSSVARITSVYNKLSKL